MSSPLPEMVTRQQWQAAINAIRVEEKELTRQADAVREPERHDEY